MTPPDDESSQNSEDATRRAYKGLFITKGATVKLTFPDGYLLRLNDSDEPEGGRLEFQIGLDTCPYWLKIAYGHLLEAESCRDTIRAAVANSDDGQLRLALEEGFIAGMQAIAASAISIDALYVATKEHITIPEDARQAWKINRTARYRQIAETFRLGFQIGSMSFKDIRDGLKVLFEYRDWAVHPPFEITTPKPHPDIGKYTEWRFVAYRYDNVYNATGFALSLTAQLANKPKDKFGELIKHCEGLRGAVLPLLEEWENRFGQLIPEEEGRDGTV